jgi:hypothetical protein
MTKPGPVLKVVEPYAVEFEQRNHFDLLKTLGERVILRRVWHLSDLEAGLTTRCVVCSAGATTEEQQMVTDVYGQSGDAYCPNCFGTGFTNGFDPIAYVTWMMATDDIQDWKMNTTGEMPENRPQVQFPWTPVIDEGDLVIRVLTWLDAAMTIPDDEAGRFTTEKVRPVTIRTGPANPTAGIIVAQVTTVDNLPQNHPYLAVPATGGPP